MTFLFTDVEGSTTLLDALGPGGYADALGAHRRALRAAFARYGGVEVDSQGDAFFVAFPTARGAIDAAATAQTVLEGGPVRVRMGIHTGEPLLTAEGYVGIDVHRAARIAAAGHGGQVLVSQHTAVLLDGLPLRDLGLHRLKDLAAAERVYQFGGDDFAPLRSLYRTNLPVPPTQFLGRERELAEVVALASEDVVRLVTVTGAGGIGKTRIALQAAAELAEEHPDGVFWVPLAALSDPALVLQAIAQTLGTVQEPDAHIGDRRMLILVDNLEHLLEAASALGRLLSSCPRLKMLVTSRERLAIAGEHEYPLSMLTDADGEQLFTERACSLDPGFRPAPPLAELCRRLDNLPLALELAAARTKLFSPEQLVERLPQRLDLLRGGRDADARQQTLRATIQWSYDLLDSGERELFARLAVFAGGCTFEAAETVCEADADQLGSLLDKSLLRRREDETGQGRFWMLETIREYALERLEESGDADELRHRHATLFFELAASARAARRSRPGEWAAGGWLDRLSAEVENLRSVLRWSLDNDLGEGLRFAAALGHFWLVRGHSQELGRWFDAAYHRAEGVPAEIRVQALMTHGDLRTSLGENTRAQALCEEGLCLTRQLGDERAQAWFLNRLGDTTRTGGNFDGALALNEQALETYRRLGDRDGVAQALHGIGDTLRDLGQFERAVEKYTEAIAIYESLDKLWNASTVMHSLADAALEQRDAPRASNGYREALTVFVDLSDNLGVAYCLAGLSCAAALSADVSRAGTLWAAAELIEDASGSRMTTSERTRYERVLSEAKGAPAFVNAYERDRQLSAERALELALPTTDRDNVGKARPSLSA